MSETKEQSKKSEVLETDFLTKEEAKYIYNSLERGVCANLKGSKLGYALSKNKRKCKGEAEDLDEAKKASDEYIDFNNQRIEIAKELCRRDPNGKLLTHPAPNGMTSYDIEDEEAYQKKLKALEDNFKSVIDQYDKQQKEYRELLKQPSDIELHLIDFELIPEDEASSAQMDVLFYMIYSKTVPKD